MYLCLMAGVKFRAKFVVVLQKQFRSIVASRSKSDFSTVNRVADSEEIRPVYSAKFHQIQQ